MNKPAGDRTDRQQQRDLRGRGVEARAEEREQADGEKRVEVHGGVRADGDARAEARRTHDADRNASRQRSFAEGSAHEGEL
ncbi:MAG: hypothetical protein M5U20_13105 [Phycisphaerales bacterium]|nr:hypothetical protein [Phycisphaerales bacterium]